MTAVATETIYLSVAKEFSLTPGARKREDGEDSGEQFLDECLAPKYREARKQGAVLFVDLDGTGGYGTSFLEESFGGLQRMYPAENILDHIEIKTEDEPYQKADIERYVAEANDK
jgi:hypothetical protein